MPRPTEIERKHRYQVIADILNEEGDKVIKPSGEFNITAIKRLLNERGLDMEREYISNLVKTGELYRRHGDKSSGVSLAMVLSDFKDAIGTVKGILKTEKNPGVRIRALDVLRRLESDLVRVAERIKEMELRKAELSRPVINVSFGTPVLSEKKLEGECIEST